MGITEISGDIKRAVGGNGVYLLLAVFQRFLCTHHSVLLHGLINFGFFTKSGSNLTVATGYSAYPDAVTNANVIIGEVNDHTTNEISSLKNQLEDTTTLMQEGDNSILEKIDTSTESITEKIDTGTEQILKNNAESTSSILDTVNQNTNNLSTQISGVENKVNNVVNNTTVNNTSSSKTAKTVKYYEPIKSYKGNSFVDALKKRGVNASMKFRKKIASVNGIKNYTAKQNSKLLNLMKKGKLVKP